MSVFQDARWKYDVSILKNKNRYIGDTYFVDKTSGSDTNSGKDGWENAFKTVTAAISAAGDYDVIIIGPGFYTEAAALTISQVGLKIFGINSSGKTRGPVGMKTPTAAGHIFTIAVNANDVEIANLAFIATGAYNAITLGGAATGYVWRTHIHDCAFFGDSTGLYAIANYGATTTPSGGAFPDVAECVVEDCYFYQWVTAAICTYGTRVANQRNRIFAIANSVGIVVGAGRPLDLFTDNYIIGKNSGDTGILITGNDDGSVIVTNNHVFNCATMVTNGVSDAGNGINYTYSDGTGIAKVDPT